MTPRNPPDLSDLGDAEFNLWFGLKSAALDDKWADVEKLLQESDPQSIPRHVLTEPVMLQAVVYGQEDVVKTLLARGYVPVEMDLQMVFQQIEEGHVPQLSEAVSNSLAALVAAVSGDLQPFVRKLIDSYEVQTVLPIAAKAGIDVMQGGLCLEYVLRMGMQDAFIALQNQGVSLYAPSVVRQMVTIPAEEDDTEEQKIFRALLRQRATENNAEGGAIIRHAWPTPDEDLRAAKFLNPYRIDANGEPVTLLGVMAAAGKAGSIFENPARWRKYPAEAKLVFDMLVEFNVQDQASLAPLTAMLERERLVAAVQRNPGLRLKPGPKP